MISHLSCLVVLLALGPDDQAANGKPPPDYAGSCTDAKCHQNFTELPIVHDPVEGDSCDVCHEIVDKNDHRFKFTSEGGALCTECHDMPTGKHEHDPAAQGECTTCHDPHASKYKHLLSWRTTAEVCTDCHDGITEDHQFLHGPVAVGACTACHDPHASDYPALLSGPERDVCLKCHLPLQEWLGSKANTHAPVEDGCTDCHNPHGSSDKMMLNEAAPGLCLSCHDDISEAATEAAVNHAPITEGRACATCHDAHTSDFASMLKQEPLAVCVSCHDKAIKTDSGELGNFKKLLADNPNHHGPIKDGNCTACHLEVHGGEHFRLLADDYPAGFYAPYEEKRYALCFECHEADAFRDERTDTLTGFRNGDHNLHFVHVNRTRKGRTCRACHQTHASKWPRHVAESVPFGEWEIPLNFEKTPQGGSCLPGCHRLYGYDREAPVKNVPTK